MDKTLTITNPIKLKAILLPVYLKKALVLSWPYLAIVSAHLIWGANFIVAKLTLVEIPVMSLAFLRFTLALVLLLPFFLSHKKTYMVEKKDFFRFALVGICMVSLNIALFYEGITRTTAASASVLTMVIPVTSVLIGWWFLREKISLLNLSGILLGLVGAIAVMGVPLLISGGKDNPENLMGNILIILASLTWVIGATLSKSLLKKYSTLTLTWVIFFIGMVTFAIPALKEYLNNPSWIQNISLLGITGLIYITLLSSICAYFFFEWGLNKLGVIKADLFQYIEPVVASSLGIFLLGEAVKIPFIIGAILIAGSVYLSTLSKEHHKHHKAHRH